MGGNSCKRLSRASFRSSENFRWLQLLRSEILSWLNCNKAVLKQSWWMVSARRCSGNTSKAKGNNHVVKNTVGYYIPQYHWKIGLQIRQICLENIWSMAAAVQARSKPPANTDSTRTSSSEILEINFWPLCKILSVGCLTDWRQSSETKKTLFRTNICALSWSNVGCRRVNVQFLGVATLLSIIIVAAKLTVQYFLHIILLIIPIEWYKVFLFMQFTTYNILLSKSFTIMRVTLYYCLPEI